MAGEKTPAAQDDTKPAGDTTPAEKPVDGKAADTKPAGTTDVKPGATTEEKPASKDDAATQQSKAPEKYSLTLPDGGRIDDHDLAIIEKAARANGWTNEQAQERVNAFADDIAAQETAFKDTTKADATYGGEHLPETLKFADAALDKLRPKGTPHGDALRALLDKSGYGSNLEVVSLLADLGRMFAEDGTAGGGSVVGNTKDAASLIYGADKP